MKIKKNKRKKTEIISKRKVELKNEVDQKKTIKIITIII